MRFTVELHQTGSDVEGTVTYEGCGEPLAFYSWLSLLRVLEMAGALAESQRQDQAQGQGRTEGSAIPPGGPSRADRNSTWTDDDASGRPQ
ncbi:MULTISPECIES: hypothetical protein [unclassified Pseudofrankia]|uniref:hypothetical protein n=1 Tax=unclassified Pseudofrankia TaxID=2994372 RepID=UPI0008D98B4D|nr:MULTISPECIES: hypothetical protein [unclassified Pseudofrankia]MDT3439329.1 hypothetical protein [Pseudofrankia sp. BMG5.37]OHV73949.1 hypothetical protein BCD48_32935 [Pseudofrankia sp. BMG5.36]